MLDLVLALVLAAQPGTVFTTEGGRLRGTVLEAGPGGVTVQLPDGATRRVDAARVSRIDYADGTSWKPTPAAAPQAAPAAPVVVAAAPVAPAARPSSMAIPAERLDTLFLAKGGRVRCLVTEEGAEGVVVRLVDGTERRYAPGQVSRIEWTDGTRSDFAGAPAAAPKPAPASAAPAPAAAPPAPATAPAPAPAAAPPPAATPVPAPAAAPVPVAAAAPAAPVAAPPAAVTPPTPPPPAPPPAASAAPPPPQLVTPGQ
jgi:2-oxoglutarate dehydrogenase E2 component (dihydrolipoamide succinyltransferase)